MEEDEIRTIGSRFGISPESAKAVLGVFRSKADKRERFSESMFREWLERQPKKMGTVRDVQRTLLFNLNEGRFDGPAKPEAHLSGMWRECEAKGIEVSKEDRWVVQSFESTILALDALPQNDIKDWNHAAVAYLEENSLSGKELINFFSRSTMMKATQIDFPSLEKKARTEFCEWEERFKRAWGEGS